MRKVYSEGVRLRLLREYLESGLGKSEFCRRHDISSIKVVNYWMEKYSTNPDIALLLSKHGDVTASRSRDDFRDEIKQLKRRIGELERELTQQRLETLMRDIMIDKAEHHYGIAIRGALDSEE